MTTEIENNLVIERFVIYTIVIIIS